MVLRALMEPEHRGISGANPFSVINDRGLEDMHDLAAGQVHRGAVKLVDDFRPEAGHAHLEAMEAREGIDVLLEPASHLVGPVLPATNVSIPNSP